MKVFLGIGVGLMAAAGIYGFVGYKNLRHDKEFETLYKSEMRSKPVTEKIEPTGIPESRELGPAVLKQAELSAKDATKRKVIVAEEQKKALDLKKAGKKNIRKKKGINYKMFSRAESEALIEEEILKQQ